MTGISVIIPTYNREHFLERALLSVQQQSLAPDEVLVIDDGSEDDTRQCVKGFGRRWEIPVSYIYQDNRGPAAARNVGIRAAKFSCLAFLDSDDHWHRNKLKAQHLTFMNTPGAVVSHTKERWLRRGVHLNQKKKHQPGDGDIFKHCLQLCAVGMSTVMVKKELFHRVGMFNEEMRCCEDYDLWLRISSRHPFLLIDEPLTVKEGGREDQVSYQYRVGMDRFRIDSILQLIRSGTLSPLQLDLALAELQRKCQVYGRGCLKHDRSEEGEKHLQLADWSDKERRKLEKNSEKSADQGKIRQ